MDCVERCQLCHLHPGCCLLINGCCESCRCRRAKLKKPGDYRWGSIEKTLEKFSRGSLQNACLLVILQDLSSVDQIDQLSLSPLAKCQLKCQWAANDQTLSRLRLQWSKNFRPVRIPKPHDTWRIRVLPFRLS